MSEKTELASKLAFNYEKEIRGCGQSTIRGLTEAYGQGSSDIYQSMACFGGGGGQCGDGICGAYAAGLLFFGMQTGRRIEDIGADPNEPRASSKNKDAMAMAGKLHSCFIKEYGTVICSQLHTRLYGRPYYLIDPEEKAKFGKSGAHEWGCTGICGNAARWAAQIYEEWLAEKEQKK